MTTRKRKPRGPSFGGRKRFSFGPKAFKLYQNFSLKINQDGVKGGPTSHGWRARTPLGPLMHNQTTGEWSWNTPGFGSIKWAGRFRDVFKGMPWMLRLLVIFWTALYVTGAMVFVTVAALLVGGLMGWL